MKQGLMRWLAGCLVLVVTAGCSVKEMLPLTEESITSKDNTLVVMRIQWIEKYNDLETREIRTKTGASLLEEKEAILERLVEKDKTALYRVLYYLNNFQFEFEGEAGETEVFTRFGKDLLQYEPFALYQFKPGEHTLKNITLTQWLYKPGRKNKKEERWHKQTVQHPETYGIWDFPKGKVVYLGDLSMVFRTKRILHGILSPEELNAKIELERIEIKDNYQDAMLELKAQKSWFPVDQVVNLAKPDQWVYLEDPKEEDPTDTKPKKKSENSFY